MIELIRVKMHDVYYTNLNYACCIISLKEILLVF